MSLFDTLLKNIQQKKLTSLQIPTRCVAMINPYAIAHNLAIMRMHLQQTNPQKTIRLCAVVKANAYGHGLQAIYKGLSCADELAVATLEEAIILRELGWQKPIWLLEGFFEAEQLPVINQFNLSCVLHHAWQLNCLEDEFNQQVIKQPLNIALKFDTGMSRLGFQANELDFIAARVAKLVLQKIINGQILFMTHFANADILTDDTLTNSTKNTKLSSVENAYAQFNILINRLKILWAQPLQNGSIKLNFSAANSAAIVWHNATHLEMVRLGIALYGATPAKHTDAQSLNLQPAMQLMAKITSIKTLQAGEFIGYGSLHQATQTTTIAIVACGYADGYPQQAPTGTPVYVNGQVSYTLGRVSMDRIIIDVSNLPVAIGDWVELWGEHISVDTIANLCGVIGYSLLCGIHDTNHRVKRLVVDDCANN